MFKFFIFPMFLIFLSRVMPVNANTNTNANANANGENEKFTQGFWISRGHEDLTRMGVEGANRIIKKEGRHLLFPKVRYGDAGLLTRNPLVRGNFVTDFFDSKMKKYYADIAFNDWANHPKLQILHFLHNYPEGKISSREDTCREGTDLMVKNTLWAFTHFNEKKSFYYWIGHVLHTIQDSFSSSHVHRSRHQDSYRDIQNICSYGRRFPGACYHKAIDWKDRIWRGGLRCLFGKSRGPACLKGNSKAAVLATTGYLVTISELAEDYSRLSSLKGLTSFPQAEWVGLVEEKLHRYFTGRETPYGGYFNCSKISSEKEFVDRGLN